MKCDIVRPHIIFPFAVLFIISFIYVSLGSIPNTLYGHDVILLYDESWRIENGQIPHNDFHITIGSGFGYLCALFLHWNNYDAIAFSWMNVAVTAICFLFSVMLLHRDIATSDHSLRTFYNRPVILLVFTLILVFGYGSYCLGASDQFVTSAMLYNRYCYAILVVIFTACFLARDVNTRMASFICGFCLCALLVIKIPFFLTGLLWIGLSFLQTRNVLRLLGIIAVCGILLIGYFLLTSISPLQMMADYNTPAALRMQGILFTPLLIKEKFQSIDYLALIVLASFGVVVLFLFKKMYSQSILALAIISCSFLLNIINFGVADIPLLPLLALLVLDQLPLKNIIFIMAGAVILLHTGYFIVKNIDGFDQAVILSGHKDNIPQMNAGHIRHLYIIREAGGSSDRHYTDKIKEAEELIKANIRAPERIESLGFENAFNVLLESMPPRHVPIAWQYDYTFNDQHFPDYNTTFSDTKILLIPKGFNPESTTSLEKIYGNAILSDFIMLAESPQWILMQKR